MLMNRIVEYVFFFGFMGAVGFLIWEMMAPFVAALALSAIIVTICYPLYEKIVPRMPKQNQSLAAFLTTIIVMVVVILPLSLVFSKLVNEAFSIYNLANGQTNGVGDRLGLLEGKIQTFAPNFELNIAAYYEQVAGWLSKNVTDIFAGTASTIFLFFISMIGSFYLFRDGKEFTKQLVIISPLPDDQDDLILKRMARSVRSVVTGTVTIALIQGTLTAFGLYMVGFERAVLWGIIAALGALIPGIGTSIVLLPSIAFLIFTGQYMFAILLSVWGMLAVGLIDNLLGPYLMSRGNKMHPFLVLLAVLGGISVFGPIGFVVGPVLVSLFLVLLELYTAHIAVDPNQDN